MASDSEANQSKGLTLSMKATFNHAVDMVTIVWGSSLEKFCNFAVIALEWLAVLLKCGWLLQWNITQSSVMNTACPIK